MSRPRNAVLVAGVGAAVLAISSAALLILLAEPLPPTVIAAGRVAVTGVAMSALAGRDAPLPWRLAQRDRGVRRRLVLAAGLLALHFAAWIASLSMTTVVRSVTLVATQPLFAGLLGRLLGDRASWQAYVGGALAVAGTAVMLLDQGGASTPVGWGDGLAVLAGAAAAAYLTVGRSVGERLPLRAYLGAIHLLAAGLLVAGAAAAGVDFVPPGTAWTDGLALVYLGLVPGVIGHGLLNWAVRFAPVHLVSMAIVLEPIGATALALLVLGGTLATTELLGAAVVLAAVTLAIWRPRPSP